MDGSILPTVQLLNREKKGHTATWITTERTILQDGGGCEGGVGGRGAGAL